MHKLINSHSLINWVYPLNNRNLSR